jgi:hypothetical protein
MALLHKISDLPDYYSVAANGSAILVIPRD